MASLRSPGPRDRLSDLPDFLLGNILSFLPNKEAGCAAALSRRWRNIFCNVHTVSFEEREGARDNDGSSFCYEAFEKKSPSWALLDNICSAFLCRQRCAGHHVPLGRLCFAFAKCHHWDFVHVDVWLSYVLRHSSQELHLDLRFWRVPICKRQNRDDSKEEEVDSGSDNTEVDEPDYKKMLRRWSYVLPRRLFTCTVIRTLCIAYCRLKLPAAVNLPFLETLSITAPSYCDGSRSIQRLISSCPRLVDLTLEAVERLKSVSVLDKRLGRFALRCCHNLKSVDIDASELKLLDYCGTVPGDLLLSLHDTPGIPSCKVDFCIARPKEVEFDGFRRFMEKISDAKHLHLHHRSLESRFFLRFPLFSSLTLLMLQGPVESCSTVITLGRVLQQTPNLEVLWLSMEEYVAVREEDETGDDEDYYLDEEDEDGNGAVDKEEDGEQEDGEHDDLSIAPDGFTVPNESSFSMSCLRHRVKEINMVHYQGGEAQRMMARLLLTNALVLERMCVVLVRKTLVSRSKLQNEIHSWVVADAQKIFQ